MKKIVSLIFLSAILLCFSYGRNYLSNMEYDQQQPNWTDSLAILNVDSILEVLDNSLSSPYSDFINFDAAYCEYAGGRLSLFKSHDKWALVFEKLGFNFRSGDPVLYEIYYFGNCLENLDVENGYTSNYKYFAIKNDIYKQLESNQTIVNFNGHLVKIPLNKKDYKALGIPLEYGTNNLYEGAVLRYLVEKNTDITYADDTLLYTCIPKEMKKIMFIDEWYHENYQQSERKVKPSNQPFYKNLATVLATGDVKKYIRPKKLNTRWKNWLDSGTY